jgi:cytochrome c oxidase subunit 2
MKTMVQRFFAVLSLFSFATLAGLGRARAQAVGIANDWQLGFQPAFSPSMEKIADVHNLLLVIITAIVLLVLGILAYILVRFRASRNPVPSKTSHNTLLEVVWTAVPIAILVVIAIPSIKTLYFQAKATNPDMTIKVIGKQWYWTYTYPDHGNFTFDSLPVADADLQPGQPRLLAVDNPVVVPVGAVVQVLTTSDDVIHNWAVPALGLKKDATPGRINETWFAANEPGVYYGQCSELCGVNHYFMPIQVVAVSREDFDAWVKQAQEKFAKAGDGPPVAMAETPAAVR